MSKYYSVHAEKVKFSSTTSAFLKFGDGDGPNLCRVKSKKVDVSSTFIENIFQSVKGGVFKSFKDLDIKKSFLVESTEITWDRRRCFLQTAFHRPVVEQAKEQDDLETRDAALYIQLR